MSIHQLSLRSGSTIDAWEEDRGTIMRHELNNWQCKECSLNSSICLGNDWEHASKGPSTKPRHQQLDVNQRTKRLQHLKEQIYNIIIYSMHWQVICKQPTSFHCAIQKQLLNKVNQSNSSIHTYFLKRYCHFISQHIRIGWSTLSFLRIGHCSCCQRQHLCCSNDNAVAKSCRKRS